MMGAGLAVAGLLVLVVVLGGLVFSWPTAVLSTVVVVAVLGVLVLAAVLWRLAPVVTLGEVGYEVRWVRGAGVRQGRWKDVEDVLATTVAGARVVVLRRRDGTTTTIPVGILAGSGDDFVRDLQQHLNRGHGYRPIQ
jgi:hypothetical protein